MSKISTILELQDRVTPVLDKIMHEYDNFVKVQEQKDKSHLIQKARAFEAARDAVWDSFANTMRRAGRAMWKASEPVRVFTLASFAIMRDSVRNYARQTPGFFRQMYRDINAASQRAYMSMTTYSSMYFTELYSKIQLFKQLMSTLSNSMKSVDKVTSDLSKIKLFNFNPNVSTADAYTDVYRAAQASRSGLSETAQLVNRIMMSGVYGEEAGSLKAATNMAETLNKALVVSGGTAEENARVLLQLSQALSSGKLQGDELRSIREQGPYLMKVLSTGLAKVDEKFANVTIGDLKKLGAEGELTSDRLIKAFELMRDEVNKTFEEKAPRTWGQGLTSIDNTVKMLMGHLIDMDNGPLKSLTDSIWKVSNFLSSPTGLKMLSYLSATIQIIGDAVSWVVDTAIQGLEYLNKHSGIVAAGFMYLGAIALSAGVSMAMTLALLLWPFIKIGLLVVGLGLLLENLGVNIANLVRNIVASLFMLGAMIYNVFIYPVLLGFTMLANFISNVFTQPKAAVINIFADMMNAVLDIVQAMCQTIQNMLNMIPGVTVKFADDVKAFANLYREKAIDPALKKYKIEKGIDDPKIMDINKAQEYGFKLIDGMGTTMNKVLSSVNGTNGALAGIADSPAVNGNVNKVGSVGKVDKPVNLNEEDLKMMQDIASREYLLSLQHVTPVVNIQTGDIRETVDAENILSMFESGLRNAIDQSLSIGSDSLSALE